jgi:hypothetical protein
MDSCDFQCTRGSLFVGSRWNKFRSQYYEDGPLLPGLKIGTAFFVFKDDSEESRKQRGGHINSTDSYL